MKVEHLPDGRTVVDTVALRAITARSTTSIRRACRRGPHGYDVEQATAELAAAPEPPLLSAPDANRYLGIPTGTVYSWASRGVLRSYERDSRGRPLYAADDLAHLHQTATKG